MLIFNRSKAVPFLLFLMASFLFVSISSAKGTLSDQLLEASSAGNISQVKILIEQGADINAKDEGGETALMWASGNQFTGKGHIEVVKYLVENGADINAEGKSGDTALIKVRILMIQMIFLEIQH